MKFTSVLATISAAAAVQAQVVVTPISNSSVIRTTSLAPVTTVPYPTPTSSVYTTVVSSFTTVCAVPTVITYNSVCYTATTASQTLTITNCPCTITTTSSYAPATAAPSPYYVKGAANKLAGGMVGALAAGAAALVL